MPLARDLSSFPGTDAPLRRSAAIHETLVRDGLYGTSSTGPEAQAGGPIPARWRIAPDPFLLSADQVAFFRSLGSHLLAFYRGLNRLYLDSVRGAQPAWVSTYLDQGKPESLVSYSRMKRFRDLLPDVIRPDIIPTEDRMVITELDSVPGGIGLTGALGRAYGQWSAELPPQSSVLSPQSWSIVGGPDGMVRGFAAMLQSLLPSSPQANSRDAVIAIVVSEEANDYRPEMRWLAARLRESGIEAVCAAPEDLGFTEEGLFLPGPNGDRPVSVLYRFFELFDLKNIPKSELILYSTKKDRTIVTPPFKPPLEEKLAFALVHHPILAPFWSKELGEETFSLLQSLMPRTWVLDPRPLPPSGIIPDLRVAGHAVADWGEVAQAGQKERRFVVKPSGFSELAWGSRGVSVGHDLSQKDWAAALESALASFPTTPYILQEFHKGRRFELSYHDQRTNEVVPMAGRARLSPYYFVTGDRAELAGILATVCPLDKKLIHGMQDAVMVPCALGSEGEGNPVRGSEGRAQAR